LLSEVIPTLDLQQLLYTSIPYVRGTNSFFLNQPLRWWYIPTLKVEPYAGGTNSVAL